MSKQYLLTHTTALPTSKSPNTTAPPDDTPTSPPTTSPSIFSLATTTTNLLVASGSSSLRIYSTRNPHIDPESPDEIDPYPLVQTLEKVHPLGCHHVVTSHGGTVAASAGFGGEVRVWDVREEDGLWVERGTLMPPTKKKGGKNGDAPTGGVSNGVVRATTDAWALALSPDGAELYTSHSSGTISIYNTTTSPLTPIPIATLTPPTSAFPLTLATSPRGTHLATGHASGALTLFNLTPTPTSNHHTTLLSLLSPIRALAFSPNSRYLAAGGDATIIGVYDVISGEQIAHLPGHGSWIMSLDFTPDGDYLVSGSWDGRVKIFDLRTRVCVATLTEGEEGGAVWGVRWISGAEERGGRFVTGSQKGRLGWWREAAGF